MRINICVCGGKCILYSVFYYLSRIIARPRQERASNETSAVRRAPRGETHMLLASPLLAVSALIAHVPSSRR